MTEPIEVFLSYSHKDDELRQELSSHLSILTRQKLIKPWDDRAIDAGKEWAQEIADSLERAEIILLLVSADFISSEYCYGIELKRALERHKSKTVQVISVIIRDCDWQESPLGQLQALPSDNQVVANGRDKHGRDQYWLQVTREVRKAAKQISDRRVLAAQQQAKLHQIFRDKALAIYQEYYLSGVLSAAAKSLLKKTWQDLGLDEAVAQKILQQVKERQEHLAEYRSAFAAELCDQAELSPAQRRLLQQLQDAYDLSFAEIKQIEDQVSADQSPKPLLDYFSTDLGSGVFLEMLKIPGGSFLMGSPEGQENDDERPQHLVTVPEFFMGKYPVTQAQWRSIAALPSVKISLKLNPSHFKGADRPVENVSWHQAVEFCQRLSRLTPDEYRLPSEAEWEYACRANTVTQFCFGDTLDEKLANFNENVRQTTAVGSYPPNVFGLLDMHGNVWEWCLDNWCENYHGAPIDGSAWINSNTEKDYIRLLRGGSWIDDPDFCRSASRERDKADCHEGFVGFRVVYAPARILT
jgi:formylglycine-generating enzyme required for sulfatase activity